MDYLLLKLPDQTVTMIYLGALSLISITLEMIYRIYDNQKVAKLGDIELFTYILGTSLVLVTILFKTKLTWIVGLGILLINIALHFYEEKHTKVCDFLRWGILSVFFIVIAVIFKDITFLGEGVFFAIVAILAHRGKEFSFKNIIFIFSALTIYTGFMGNSGSNLSLNEHPVLIAKSSNSSTSAKSGKILNVNWANTYVDVISKKKSKIIVYYNGTKLAKSSYGNKYRTLMSHGYDKLELRRPGYWKIVDKVGKHQSSVTIKVNQTKKQEQNWLRTSEGLKIYRENNYHNGVRAKLKLDGLNKDGEYVPELDEKTKDDFDKKYFINVSGTTNPNAKVIISNYEGDMSELSADSKGHFSYKFKMDHSDILDYDPIEIKALTADKKKMNKKTVYLVEPEDTDTKANDGNSDDDNSKLDDDDSNGRSSTDNTNSPATNDSGNNSNNNTEVAKGDMETDQQGTIVGNSRTMIYHTPDQQGYRMNSANAVYFNSEAEAKAAGYRKSLR